MKRLLTLLTLFLLSTALAETRTIMVNVENLTDRPVPVSMSLLELRDAVGAEFQMNWDSLRVLIDGEKVSYQIDDTDLNGRLSAGDELAFLATGAAEIQLSDEAMDAPTYDAALTVTGDDPAVVESSMMEGFTVEIPATGLPRIAGFDGTDEVLADELGILRFSGYPESTYWANEELGPHEEYTTLEDGGMRHVQTETLPAGPARVTVVSEYASDRFAGLNQRVVARIYATGDVDVSTEVTFRGYADMMKLQSMATRVMSQADPEALHLLPVFRKLVWADQLGETPQDYFAEREAVTNVDGESYLAFRADDSLSPLYWSAPYIFASAEAWRANYSPSLGIAVAEIAAETPEVASDNNDFLSGDTWVFESQEFRTGVFKWTADEFGTYEATQDVTPSTPNHYLPGDTVNFRHVYSVYQADSEEAAIQWAADRQAELASVALESE